MSDAEKIPFMEEWWFKTHEAIVQCGLHRTALEKTVNNCEVVVRDGVQEFFKMASHSEIPILVFSGGLGDVIQLLLNRFQMKSKNVRVVSNFMKFDDQDLLVDFVEPTIHTFNKTVASANSNYFSEMSKRSSMILLGDSTADVHMADGADNCNVLRIGFLNESVDKRLDLYKSIYDIVLVNDGTFSVPLKILRQIIQS